MKYCITWFPFSVLKSFKLHRQHNALHIKRGFLPHFHTSKLNLVLHISSGNAAVITHCLLPKQWGFCSEGSPYPARQIKATRHTQCVCSTAVPQPFLRCWKQNNVLFRLGGGPSQALHCHSHPPISTGLSYPTTQVLETTTVQSYHPSTDGHTILCFSPHQPLPPANLLPSLFPQLLLTFYSCLLNCFFCMATARKICSKTAILQLQNSCWEHRLGILACSKSWCMPLFEARICTEGQALQEDW